jgi:hypothetical protein
VSGPSGRRRPGSFDEKVARILRDVDRAEEPERPDDREEPEPGSYPQPAVDRVENPPDTP